MQKIRDILKNLSPDARKKINVAALVAGCTVFFTVAWFVSRVEKLEPGTNVAPVTIPFDRDAAEKNLYEQTSMTVQKQEARVLELTEQIKNLSEQVSRLLQQQSEQVKNTSGKSDANTSDVDMSDSGTSGGIINFPSIPAGNNKSEEQNRASVAPPRGIQVVSVPDDDIKNVPQEKNTGIYLPPSFMKATLLTGVAAPTVAGGTSHPVPMMFRVQTPAMLPNHVRKNLKGCFVIAEGKGDLASERIKTRLVTLSCISRNGERVIDQKISGFAVDADGQVDIRGRVVSRMGRSLARVTLAGFLGGVGEAMASAQGTLNYTDSGVVKDFGQGTDTYLKAGLGKGLQTSLEKLQDFYLKLASQTLPVIETGPSKQVHLVVSEGTKLNIFKTSPDDFQTGRSG